MGRRGEREQAVVSIVILSLLLFCDHGVLTSFSLTNNACFDFVSFSLCFYSSGKQGRT